MRPRSPRPAVSGSSPAVRPSGSPPRSVWLARPRPECSVSTSSYRSSIRRRSTSRPGRLRSSSSSMATQTRRLLRGRPPPARSWAGRSGPPPKPCRGRRRLCLCHRPGSEAGGHVRGTQPLDQVPKETLDAVAVPVVAAGGIGNRERVVEVMAAGAAAVRIGTRFVAATEADAHPDYVAALVAATASETEITTVFGADWPDAPHRVLRSAVDAASARQGATVARLGTGRSGASIRCGRRGRPSATCRRWHSTRACRWITCLAFDRRARSWPNSPGTRPANGAAVHFVLIDASYFGAWC